MNVNFDGRTYSFEVKPGLDGYRQFTEAIRRAFALPDDSELNITFTCDEPSTGAVHTGAPFAADAQAPGERTEQDLVWLRGSICSAHTTFTPGVSLGYIFFCLAQKAAGLLSCLEWALFGCFPWVQGW